MLVLFIDLLIPKQILPSSLAKDKNILGNWLCLSSHRTLICCDIVAFNQNAISWNLHSFINGNHLSDQHKVLMDLKRQPVSPNSRPLFLISHRVQFQELSLLLVVVDCRHRCTNKDCYQNGESFYPSGCAIFGSCDTHLETNGKAGSQQENLQDEIVECFQHQRQESWRLFHLLLIVSEVLPTSVEVLLSIRDALPLIRK